MDFEEIDFKTSGPALHLARGAFGGPPFVFLHGVMRRWQDFLPVVPAVSARWEVLALDFRGHGGSARAAGKYRVVDYVEDAVALLRTQVGEPAVVYGHSLGAMVAAAAAVEVPDRVRAIVLEDPPFDSMGSRIRHTPFLSFFQGMRELIEKGQNGPELAAAMRELRFGAPGGPVIRLGDVRDASALRFAASCLARMDPAVLKPIIEERWLDGYDVERVLRAIRCPALVLQADGAAGGMLTDPDAEMAERILPDCLRIRFEKVGHLIHWADVPGLLRHLMAFLESIR